MSFLYHRVPKNMQGNVLYPLNRLKKVAPEAYAHEVSKYEGRDWVREVYIPTLDCLWNDVLHFTPVPPRLVREALTEAGGGTNYQTEYYQINAYELDPKYTVVYLGEITDGVGNFAPYDPEELGKYAQIPEKTRKYYREMFAQGKKPLLFHAVPHVLYRGELDISEAPVVNA